jgi:hypothetical protein
MDKVMPVIQMPEKEPEPVPEETNNNLPDSGDPSDKDLIDQIQEEVLEENYENNDHLIEVTERNIPEEDEVFAERPPSVKPIAPQEDPEEPIPMEGEFKPSGKRKYTRKAPMSQKQKDHLAKIRKIASEKRAQQREEKEKLKKQKEEEKEEARIKKAEERILAKQKKEAEKINQTSAPVTPKIPQQPPVGYSQADLEKAMFSAIASYETIRKKEKEEKKKRELSEARQRQMQRTLQQAIQPDKPPDPWRQFFA